MRWPAIGTHACFKFPGRQLVIVSRNWGFTKHTREQYAKLKEDNRLIPDGAGVKVLNGRGSLDQWKKHVTKFGQTA